MPKIPKKPGIFFSGQYGNGFFFYGEVATEETKHLYVLKEDRDRQINLYQRDREELRRLLPVELIHCSSDNDSLTVSPVPPWGSR